MAQKVEHLSAIIVFSWKNINLLLVGIFKGQGPRSCYLQQLRARIRPPGGAEGGPALYQHRQNPYRQAVWGKKAISPRGVYQGPARTHLYGDIQ